MAKPKLALIPAAQGDKLYSVLPSSGVGDFDFTRSGGATRINSQGLIETVADGVSRLNYPLIDGKVVGCPSHLLEPQRTNLALRSNELDLWATKSNMSTTSNYSLSPDGSVNSNRLLFSANGFTHNSLAQVVWNYYSVSVYAKRNSGSGNVGFFTNGSAIVNSAFNLTSEWQRFEYNYQAQNSSVVGIAGDLGADISVYGFQLEQGSYPTSYIPTNGSSVTRSAETANNSGDASTFNDSEGVLMAEMSRKEGNTSTSSLSLNNGTTSNNITFYYYQSNRLFFDIFSGVATVTGEITNVDTSNLNKIALKYKTGDISFFLNGFELATKTNAISLSGLSEIKLNYADGSAPLNGSTKQLQYFDSALNDSDLETLTSWVSFTDMANGQLYTIE